MFSQAIAIGRTVGMVASTLSGVKYVSKEASKAYKEASKRIPTKEVPAHEYIKIQAVKINETGEIWLYDPNTKEFLVSIVNNKLTPIKVKSAPIKDFFKLIIKTDHTPVLCSIPSFRKLYDKLLNSLTPKIVNNEVTWEMPVK